jgi:hypothetical protein
MDINIINIKHMDPQAIVYFETPLTFLFFSKTKIFEILDFHKIKKSKNRERVATRPDYQNLPSCHD